MAYPVARRRRVRRHHQRRARQRRTILPVLVLALSVRGACRRLAERWWREEREAIIARLRGETCS